MLARRYRDYRSATKRCYICGTFEVNGIQLSDHHIIPLAEGGRDAYTNIVTLCEPHHNEVEGPGDAAWKRVVEARARWRRENLPKQVQRTAKQHAQALKTQERINLEAMGVSIGVELLTDDLNAMQLRKLRRELGYWPNLNGVRAGTHKRFLELTNRKKEAYLLFEAPLEEYMGQFRGD